MPTPIPSELESLALKHERKIRDALLKVFQEIRDESELKVLTEIFERQGIQGVLLLLSDLESKLDTALINELKDATEESGRMFINIGVLPEGAILSGAFAFNIINQDTVRALNQHRLTLVRELSEETRSAVIRHLQAGFVAGQNANQTARDFKNIVGLTQQQEQAVRNFRSMLEDDTLRRSDRKRALTLQSRDKRFDRTIRNIIEGRSVKNKQERIDAMVQRFRDRLLQSRASTIAITESLAAVSLGEFEVLRQLQNDGRLSSNLRRFWSHAGDERVRAAHNRIPDMNSNGVSIEEVFQTPLGSLRFPRDPNGIPQNRINCLHPDSVVQFASPLSFTRRFYSGKMMVVTTKQGSVLKITPNHPVLTDRGWVPACFLEKDMNVVSTRNSDGKSFGNHNIDDMEPTIEQVFNSFSDVFPLMRKSSSGLDFHNDSIINQDINIISPNGGLPFGFMTEFSDPFYELGFPHADFAEGIPLCDSLLMQKRFGFFTPSNSIMSGIDELTPFGFAGISHSMEHGFTSTSGFDSRFIEAEFDSAPVNSSFFANSFDRQSTFVEFDDFGGDSGSFLPVVDYLGFSQVSHGDVIFSEDSSNSHVSTSNFVGDGFGSSSVEVFLDDIVDVHDFSYEGYVYNIDDCKSYYICDGIATHNCRCGLYYQLV